MPFGLSSASWVFTKILKPIAAYLRNKKIKSVFYLDDILILANSYSECKTNLLFTVKLLEHLGFLINNEKSQLIPNTTCKYLGFIFDSKNMIIKLPLEKKIQNAKLIKKFSSLKRCTIRNFASFIGILSSCCFSVKYGWAHIKDFEIEKILALQANEGNFDEIMSLPDYLKTQFLWWERNIHIAEAPIKISEFILEIYSDASLSGWGAFCNGKRTHGFWNETESQYHINELELWAALFSLKCFTANIKNCSVLLRIDNTTAISYINHMGGTKVKNLNTVAKKIWEWCEDRNIWVVASYIPSKENEEADSESRKLCKETEYQLNNSTFNTIVSHMGKPDIDIFASRLNHKCKKYISWFRDPDAICVDAFSIKWNKFFFYAFPPFAIILKVIEKIIEEKATGILVVPYWPAQPWFPMYFALLMKPPIFFSNHI